MYINKLFLHKILLYYFLSAKYDLQPFQVPTKNYTLPCTAGMLPANG